MSSINKRKSIIVFIVAFVVVFVMLLVFKANCRCVMEPQSYYGPHWDLFTQAAFSIAGTDEMGTRITILETDEFGRKLFEVKFFGNSIDRLYIPNRETSGRLFAYAICQKADDECVYYYEDDSFSIFGAQDEFTDDERNALKQRNDWNKPLNDEKLTSRRKESSNIDRLSLTADYDNNWRREWHAMEVFRRHVTVNENALLRKVLLDIDKDGGMLFIMWLDYDNDQAAEGWFMLMPPSASGQNSLVSKINDPIHYWRELKEFKLDNGWNSP